MRLVEFVAVAIHLRRLDGCVGARAVSCLITIKYRRTLATAGRIRPSVLRSE